MSIKSSLTAACVQIKTFCSAFNRKKMDKEITEMMKDVKPFTIFANDCVGGCLYHNMGKEFTSPLINIAIDHDYFLKFLERPEYYLKQELVFRHDTEHKYPVARLDDVELRFVHYHSDEEAAEKFRERTKRIIWDNIYVICTDHGPMQTDPDYVGRFDKLPFKKIMFVSRDEPIYEWMVKVPYFHNRDIYLMTDCANFRGQRFYETQFDIHAWIKTGNITGRAVPL